ncbi:hypothetical protein MBLNU230_g7589t1 [Neophaeotheca triangularis]
MARIFITGSSDGIGQAAAKILCEQGHEVYLHARNAERASQAKTAVPGAKDVLIADLSKQDETKELANQVNKLGKLDTIVHNAGLGFQQPYSKSAEGFATVFAVNSLAPYILTCLMNKPKRILYMSSSLHMGGDGSLDDIAWTSRSWKGFEAYSDSKLHNVMLALAVSKRFKDVHSNAMDPGWVQTKMGGAGAPGDVAPPSRLLAEYAAGEHKLAGVSGTYFNVKGATEPLAVAKDVGKQDEYLKKCEGFSGVSLAS